MGTPGSPLCSRFRKRPDSGHLWRIGPGIADVAPARVVPRRRPRLQLRGYSSVCSHSEAPERRFRTFLRGGVVFEVYQLPEEHLAIREAVRAVCDGKVAPNAAAADENSEFPQASYAALRPATSPPPPTPGESGGAGAAPPAPAIFIEEVARA